MAYQLPPHGWKRGHRVTFLYDLLANSSQVGFQGLFFGRIDYQDREQRERRTWLTLTSTLEAMASNRRAMASTLKVMASTRQAMASNRSSDGLPTEGRLPPP